MSMPSHIMPACIVRIVAKIEVVIDENMRHGHPLNVVIQSETLGGGTLPAIGRIPRKRSERTSTFGSLWTSR